MFSSGGLFLENGEGVTQTILAYHDGDKNVSIRRRGWQEEKVAKWKGENYFVTLPKNVTVAPSSPIFRPLNLTLETKVRQTYLEAPSTPLPQFHRKCDFNRCVSFSPAIERAHETVRRSTTTTTKLRKIRTLPTNTPQAIRHLSTI